MSQRKEKDNQNSALGRGLAWADLKGAPGRSLGLMALSLLLGLCILAGSLVLMGLRGGLASLDARLGADIMVVPYQAATENYLEDTILMGNKGYYYMPSSRVNDITQKIEGVAQVSPQLYLATTTSSCCSYRVSIVGFDPATDFTITPWVQSSYDGTLQDYEVFVGHDLNAYPGDQLTFFGVPVTVAARLDETGTYLDTAVYTNMTTAKALVAAGEDKHLFTYNGTDVDPENMVSCIMVGLEDGYSAASVEGEIKTYISQVATVKTATSVEDVSNKLSGIQNIAVALVVAVWVLVFVIEAVAFRMIFASRTKDFAVLRMVGMSRRRLSRLLVGEASLVGLGGSVVGAALGVLVTSLFAHEIETSLNMPFLLPRGWTMLLVVIAGVVVSVAAGALAALLSARRAANVDAALILRGEG